MPSKDPINEKANEWMSREGIITQGAAASAPRTRKATRKMAAAVQRLAVRLGMDPDEVAARIPDDTLRRLGFPVIERRLPDGTREFEHDLGIKDAARNRF